ALDALIADPEYRVADLQIRDARPDRADHAREVAAENVGKLDAAAVSAAAEPDLVIGCVDARRMDIDDDLARPGGRIRHLGQAQHLGPAMLLEYYCLHASLPSATGRGEIRS